MTSSITFATPRVVKNLDDCFFYHTMDLPGLGVVPGQWDLRGRFEEYTGGVNVAGKSVLDVGTATGFLSFEAEQKGAARVVSFDMSDARQQVFLPFKDKLFYRDHERWAESYNAEVERWKNAYWLCHRLLQSKAQVFYGDICKLPLELGQFDVVVIGSVLEHLNDPVTALGSIARLAKQSLVIVTPLLETDEPIANFIPRASNPDADFTWWVYSIGTYREVLGMLGFDIQAVTRASYYYEHAGRFEDRSTIIATRS